MCAGRYPISMMLLLALAACVPATAEYTKTEAPAALQVQGGTSQSVFAFAPGSARLSRREDARLHQLVASGGIRPADRVVIAAAGPPTLAGARSAAIAGQLLRWRIVADIRSNAWVAPNRAIVTVDRYAVTFPPCPNWSMNPGSDFTNQTSSNFGCADAVNLGLMVASPADLVQGRPLGPADGKPAAAAVARYLDDKVAPLPAGTSLGPIGGGTSTGAPTAAPTGY